MTIVNDYSVHDTNEGLGKLILDGGWKARLFSNYGFRGLLLMFLLCIVIMVFNIAVSGLVPEIFPMDKPWYVNLTSPFVLLCNLGFFLLLFILFFFDYLWPVKFKIYENGIIYTKSNSFKKIDKNVKKRFDMLISGEIESGGMLSPWGIVLNWNDKTCVVIHSNNTNLPLVKEWILKTNIPKHLIVWTSYNYEDNVPGWTKLKQNSTIK